MTRLHQAHYEGRCPECSAPIELGDWIGKHDDSGEVWVCRNCLYPPPVERQPICVLCHITNGRIGWDGFCDDCREDQ